MRKLTILIIVFIFACVGPSKVFESIGNSSDQSYGYNMDNPILIGQYSHWQKNTDLAYIYLSKLNKNGQPLKMLLHATVDKPKDQPRKRESIPRLYGTTPSMGGRFLDMWRVLPEGTTDTIDLFFDVEISGDLKIPAGLSFDIYQQNNIYR